MQFNDTKLRIFHGPVNTCNTGYYIAKELRNQGLVAKNISYYDDVKYDQYVDVHSKSKILKIIFQLYYLFKFIFKYDVFHLNCAKTLLLWNLDLPLLKIFNKKIVMTYVGSDVRISQLENKRNPYFELTTAKKASKKRDGLKIRRMKFQSLFVDKIMVVDDLIYYTERYFPANKISQINIHKALDLKGFTPSYNTNHIPIVLHAPSDLDIKGTSFIEKAIEELKERGVKIQYKRIHKLSHDKALELYRNCDIIIDQVLIGSFGLLSVEGMALGKPVCVYLLDEIIEKYHPDIPLINVNIDNLGQKLEYLINNPKERIAIGKKGRAYVEKNYNIEVVTKQLIKLYQHLIGN